jgi:hypothetical protein
MRSANTGSAESKPMTLQGSDYAQAVQEMNSTAGPEHLMRSRDALDASPEDSVTFQVSLSVTVPVVPQRERA